MSDSLEAQLIQSDGIVIVGGEDGSAADTDGIGIVRGKPISAADPDGIVIVVDEPGSALNDNNFFSPLPGLMNASF